LQAKDYNSNISSRKRTCFTIATLVRARPGLDCALFQPIFRT